MLQSAIISSLPRLGTSFHPFVNAVPAKLPRRFHFVQGGKSSLVGGTLWESYSQKVHDRMNNPRFRGELTAADAAQRQWRLVVVDHGAEACGDQVRLSLLVDPKTDTIKDARFKTFGCGTAIAASDALAELCIGRTIDNARKITNLDVEQALRDVPDKPAVPPQKMHCSVMAYDVMKKAAAAYKGVDAASLEDEDIICQCAQVSLSTIVDAIKINNLKTVEQVMQYTKAGAFCGSCVKPGGHEKRDRYLVDILAQVRDGVTPAPSPSPSPAAPAEGKKATAAEPPPFSSLSLGAKLSAIEAALDKHVRPVLGADGGDVEVMEVAASGDGWRVAVAYQGRCCGCPSAGGGTLLLMERALQKHVDAGIVVVQAGIAEDDLHPVPEE